MLDRASYAMLDRASYAMLDGPGPNATAVPYGGLCVALVSPHSGRAVLANGLLLGVPLLLFAALLAARARGDVRRLAAARSRLLWGFYGGAWAAAALSLARLGLLAASARAAKRTAPAPSPAVALDVAWLGVRAGLTTVEVGAVAFLAAGHLAPTGIALARTAAVAGGVAGLEAAVEGVALFKGGVPLFRWGGAKGAAPTPPTSGNGTQPHSPPSTRGDLSRAKWGWWAGRDAVAAAAYGCLASLPASRARALLPARPAFYRYASQMAALYGIGSAGAALLALGARRAGYCTSALASLGLGSAWPALFAAAFLGDFFSDTGLDADAAYYAEMRDAGYFAEEEEEGEDVWF